MDGRARAAKRKIEASLSQAWHTEAFARTKKLPRLHDLFGEKPKAQTPTEILEAFRTFQRHGAPMKITRINYGGRYFSFDRRSPRFPIG